MLTSFLGPRLARMICGHIHRAVCIYTYIGTCAHTRTNTNTFTPRSQAMQVDSNENSKPMGFKSVVLGAQHFLPCQLGPTVSTWLYFALPLTVTSWYFGLLFGFEDASFWLSLYIISLPLLKEPFPGALMFTVQSQSFPSALLSICLHF